MLGSAEGWGKAAIFAICDCDAHRGPQKLQRFPRREQAMLHFDLSVRWKVASDLRSQTATSEPKTLSFCRISGDLAPSTRKSLAIAIVRFWCQKKSSIFCPSWGNEEDLRGTKKANIAPNFGTYFRGHFDYKTWLKMRCLAEMLASRSV